MPDEVAVRLDAYMSFLAKWNAKINLTALPLASPTNETFDRLLIEPLLAARYAGSVRGPWFDLGSGGGSPALPMKTVLLETHLTMVESKVRKAVFLREAVNAMRLLGTKVENERFEDIAGLNANTAELITVRAVRVDATLASIVSQLLKASGRLFLFRPSSQHVPMAGFEPVETVDLVGERGSCLSVYRPMFHVEHKGNGEI
ncbi:MAG TPA: RsmG family class I SAM-dependent methyltransferase [Vicinamibacterales bacterium]|nr:RsmG family class I SAM-dependent methyltransferase [Vicinamibacterales bacterium]